MSRHLFTCYSYKWTFDKLENISFQGKASSAGCLFFEIEIVEEKIVLFILL